MYIGANIILRCKYARAFLNLSSSIELEGIGYRLYLGVITGPYFLCRLPDC